MRKVSYSILIDGAIWVNNINPDTIWKSSGKKNMGLLINFNKIWLENNHSLKSLEGKYIDTTIVDSEYGKKIKYLNSTDIIGDFSELLKKNNGQSFTGEMPIYELLEKANYQLNDDSSITLKIKTEDGFELRLIKYYQGFICYKYGDFFDLVTIENIEILYNKFYKDVKYISDDRHGDGSYHYEYRKMDIVKVTNHYRESRKDHKPDRRYDSYDSILSLGQFLTDEHKIFLSNAINK